MTWELPEADTYFRDKLTDRGFQVEHLEQALVHCRRFRTAIDGGAHIGTWSAYMATKFRNVIAFEPAPDTFACLTANTKGLHNVLHVKAALGEKAGAGRLFDDDSRPGNTGARHLDQMCAIDRSEPVEITTVDSIGLDDLDFLKLDVEGYELRALQGAAETLRRCKPVILIEVKKFNPPRFGVDHRAAARFLTGMGFREAQQIRNDVVFVWGEG